MDITLQPVTRQTFERVIALKTTPEQERFVAPNLYSLAEAAVEPDWTPLAICAGEEVVGFAMFGLEAGAGRWWIIRYMIDAGRQGQGYGTAALPKLIALMTERHAPREILLGYEPENAVAARLYARFGFVPTGELEAGEIIARLEL